MAAIGLGDHAFPGFPVDVRREDVGVISGVADHGEDVAGPRVKRHQGAVAVTERGLGGLLDVQVEGEAQITPWNRVDHC